MSLLAELKTIISTHGIPVETGVFSGIAPERYIVLTPMTDELTLFADNMPEHEVQEVRVSLYDKGNYRSIARVLTGEFLHADMTVSDRRYIAHEHDTGYHHYAIDVAKIYDFKEE